MAARTKVIALSTAATAGSGTLLAVMVNLATDWKTSLWSWICVAVLTVIVFVLSFLSERRQTGTATGMTGTVQHNTASGNATISAVQNGNQRIDLDNSKEG